MTDTTKPELDSEGFPVLTDELLVELLDDPCIAYDSVALDKLLDEIARLQGDGKDDPHMMAIFWDNYEASEAASEADDAAFERDLMARHPGCEEWPARERERAIRAGLIPDEPVDDEDDERLWPDDLAS